MQLYQHIYITAILLCTPHHRGCSIRSPGPRRTVRGAPRARCVRHSACGLLRKRRAGGAAPRRNNSHVRTSAPSPLRIRLLKKKGARRGSICGSMRGSIRRYGMQRGAGRSRPRAGAGDLERGEVEVLDQDPPPLRKRSEGHQHPHATWAIRATSCGPSASTTLHPATKASPSPPPTCRTHSTGPSRYPPQPGPCLPFAPASLRRSSTPAFVAASRPVQDPGSGPVQDPARSRIQDPARPRIPPGPGSGPAQDPARSRIPPGPGSRPVQDPAAH